MAVLNLPELLDNYVKTQDKEAYSSLIVGDYQKAERIYRQQYERLRLAEEQLPAGDKYHKGSPLFNLGISLIFQKKILEGFQKIALAYIEDLLNFPRIDDAQTAPASRTLRSYQLITAESLNQITTLANQARTDGRVPKNPEEILRAYREAQDRDISENITAEGILENPITIEQLEPLITKQLDDVGPKEKRVFVGGNYLNIAILRFIAAQIESIDDYKAVIPIDLPELAADDDHLIHDTSLKYLEGCSKAIFEVSVSDGHLMEIEKANTLPDLNVILVYQKTKEGSGPKITRMLMTTNFTKNGYLNFSELTRIISEFLNDQETDNP